MTITRLDILKMAARTALDDWCFQDDKYKELPSELNKARLDKANERYEAVRFLLLAEERKEVDDDLDELGCYYEIVYTDEDGHTETVGVEYDYYSARLLLDELAQKGIYKDHLRLVRYEATEVIFRA